MTGFGCRFCISCGSAGWLFSRGWPDKRVGKFILSAVEIAFFLGEVGQLEYKLKRIFGYLGRRIILYFVLRSWVYIPVGRREKSNSLFFIYLFFEGFLAKPTFLEECSLWWESNVFIWNTDCFKFKENKTDLFLSLFSYCKTLLLLFFVLFCICNWSLWMLFLHL